MNYGRNASRLLRTIHSAAITVAPVPVPAPIPTPTRGQAHHIPYPPHAFSLDLHEKVEYLRNVSLQATEVEVSQPQVTHSDAELHALYADVLNVGPEEPCTDRSIKDSPTDDHIDRHIKAHLTSTLKVDPSDPTVHHAFPTSALEALHAYEAAGSVVPIKSYTRVISALLHVRTSPSSDPRLGASAAYSQAWDLFSHMRYVAHPTPDAHLYAVMIRACASASSSRASEPERALDLWTEMQENRIEPTRAAYEAIVLVFGRAGREWLGESVRFAKEMRARYCTSPSSVASERRIWCALLEGCKRVGDLPRARWILAEALRLDPDSGKEGTEVGMEAAEGTVDAKMMCHLFHTYTSYQPPFSRGATRLVDDPSAAQGESSSSSPVETHDGHTDAPTFSRLPPQTASDVLAEVEFLFKRIARDTQSPLQQREDSDDPLLGKFANVQLTPLLLNAYMSVFYKHASIERSREIFTSLFGPSRIATFPGNTHTFLEALERCALASKDERLIAGQWAQELWAQWESVEAKGVATGHEDVGIFARLIERAHTAMRRILVLTGDIDGALGLLRKFVNRYPPSTLIQPRFSSLASSTSDTSSVPVPAPPTITLFAKPPILSTRVTLTNPKLSDSATAHAKPLVRLSSAVGPRDDRVPPIIAFSDIELLHHRLVALKRVKDVGYLKWVCEAYRGTLRRRREAVLHG